MKREEGANKLIVSVFVTLFFSGLSSIYIAQAVSQNDPASQTAAPSSVNTTPQAGNIAASTFFMAGAVLAFLVTVMLALQLKKARRA